MFRMIPSAYLGGWSLEGPDGYTARPLSSGDQSRYHDHLRDLEC